MKLAKGKTENFPFIDWLSTNSSCHQKSTRVLVGNHLRRGPELTRPDLSSCDPGWAVSLGKEKLGLEYRRIGASWAGRFCQVQGSLPAWRWEGGSEGAFITNADCGLTQHKEFFYGLYLSVEVHMK
jgi:hypothetical protein